MDQLFEELRIAVGRSVDSWLVAGKIVVELCDGHRLTIAQIAERAGVQRKLLGELEKMGRGLLLPSLMAEAFPATQYLARLPLSEQQRLLDGSIELVTVTDGGHDLLVVAVRDLTDRQCRQVFAADEVRSAGAQRVWLESQATNVALGRAKDEAAITYKVQGGKLKVLKECEFSRRELAQILSQLA